MHDSIERIDEYLSMANKNSHDYARGMNLKGCALDEIRRYEKALECFERAAEISPDNETFQKNRQRLFILLEERRVMAKSPLGRDDIEYLARLSKMRDG